MSKNRFSELSKSGICLCLLPLLLLAGSASAQTQLATNWLGSYYYPKGDKRPPVPFTLRLSVNGISVSGRVSEPATFGNGSSPNLYANIIGTLQGSNISFVKTYDGTAGVSHSVQYRGVVSADGTSMSGTWTIGNVSGSFSATEMGK